MRRGASLTVAVLLALTLPAAGRAASAYWLVDANDQFVGEVVDMPNQFTARIRFQSGGHEDFYVAETAGFWTVSTPQPTATPVPPAGPLAVTIRARNVAFDRSSVTVPSGGQVRVTFINEDASVEHNLSIGLTENPSCTGPCTQTYQFTAPATGTLSFYWKNVTGLAIFHSPW